MQNRPLCKPVQGEEPDHHNAFGEAWWIDPMTWRRGSASSAEGTPNANRATNGPHRSRKMNEFYGRVGIRLEPPVRRHAQTVRDLITCRRAPGSTVDSRQTWRTRPPRWPTCCRELEAEERFCMPPCMECGAMTADEAGSKCRGDGNQDDCHGCRLAGRLTKS